LSERSRTGSSLPGIVLNIQTDVTQVEEAKSEEDPTPAAEAEPIVSPTDILSSPIILSFSKVYLLTLNLGR
jgi:hypothetical protein